MNVSPRQSAGELCTWDVTLEGLALVAHCPDFVLIISSPHCTRERAGEDTRIHTLPAAQAPRDGHRKTWSPI